MRAFVNFAAFQIGWFACILGAAHGAWLAGVGIALTIVVLHVVAAGDAIAELKLIGAAVAMGVVFDSAFAASGVVRFAAGVWSEHFTTPWLLALWALFATTLNVSLRWVKTRLALAVAFGAAGGPLAYLAGAKLGALEFVSYAPALIGLAVAWGAAMAALVLLARRFDGVSLAKVAPGRSAAAAKNASDAFL